MEKVSVLKCNDYEIEKLDKIIEKHFAALSNGTTIIKPGDTVVIKPNLVICKAPVEAVTTHPAFIAAIIRAVKRRGGNPVIAESPGGVYTKAALKHTYFGTGIEEIAQKEGATLNFDIGTTHVKTRAGKMCSFLDIINPVVKADVVISAAKLKTHGQMTYSGAVKNLFGVLPGLMKPEFHYRFSKNEDFADMIVDICETVCPTISFIDGIVGMEGNGPSGGTAKQLGLTFAALNPYAVDLLASTVVGMSPDKIPIIAAAIRRGLCPDALSKLCIVGDDIADIHETFKLPESISLDFADKLPGFIKRPLQKLFTPRPVIKLSVCIGCGKCAESCPQKTIRMVNHKAQIDYKKCAKCYCCHEMCPQRAIDIKHFRLFGR